MAATTTPSGIRYPFPINRDLYKWPTFSDAEFARRHAIVRKFMEDRGLDCLLITGNNSIWERGWANIRWVSNFMGTMELDCTCVFPLVGDPMLAILGLNARLPDRIARSVITDVRGALNTANLIVDRIRELGLEKGRIGIIQPAPFIDISHDHHMALVTAFPQAEFPRYSDEFWMTRMVMSDEELACLDEAGRIGDAAVQGIIDRLRPGMKEQDLFNIIYDVFSKEGGENPCMVLAASENMFEPTSAFQRPRAVDRTIKQGDILLLELGARDGHGYEAQDRQADHLRAAAAGLQGHARRLPRGVPRHRRCAEARLHRGRHPQGRPGHLGPRVHGGRPARARRVQPDRRRPVRGDLAPSGQGHPAAAGMGLCVEIHPCSEDILRGVFLGDTFVITEDGNRCVNKLAPSSTRSDPGSRRCRGPHRPAPPPHRGERSSSMPIWSHTRMTCGPRSPRRSSAARTWR